LETQIILEGLKKIVDEEKNEVKGSPLKQWKLNHSIYNLELEQLKEVATPSEMNSLTKFVTYAVDLEEGRVEITQYDCETFEETLQKATGSNLEYIVEIYQLVANRYRKTMTVTTQIDETTKIVDGVRYFYNEEGSKGFELWVKDEDQTELILKG
tara:strand:+ start:63 stop:527 length:465 start_codon:yes stop_codon:yes gene_type:complete